jgi:hypothetical protein
MTVTNLEKQLAELTVSDSKPTNCVAINFVPRQCAGRFKIELGDITKHNIQQVKRLNEAVLPATYPKHFYDALLSYAEFSDFSKIVYFNDCLVGAIICRIQVKNNAKQLCIMTLGKAWLVYVIFF